VSPLTFIATRIDRFVLPVVSRHALDVLKREYDSTAAHRILWRAWHAFGEISTRIPSRRRPATRVTLAFAAAWAALHRSIVHEGADEGRATAIVAEIGARSHRRLARLPWWLARLVTLDTVTRLAVGSRLCGFIANGSSIARRLASPVNGSVTDVNHCAALELYRDLGITHLSRSLMCNLELAVAEEWDAEVTRAHSMANGDTRCHLHWRSIAPQHGGRHAQAPVH